MADHTHIEWTDATWNPITGCTLVSEGCRHCYAATLAATRLKNIPSRAGLARMNAAGEAKFTGEVRFNEQWIDQPLRWRKPRRIFVCAHSDLFHEAVPDEWIDRIFAVMALAPQHTFQCLSKRPERMQAYLSDSATVARVAALVYISRHGQRDNSVDERALSGGPGRDNLADREAARPGRDAGRRLLSGRDHIAMPASSGGVSNAGRLPTGLRHDGSVEDNDIGAQACVGGDERAYTCGHDYQSQGRGEGEQSAGELGVSDDERAASPRAGCFVGSASSPDRLETPEDEVDGSGCAANPREASERRARDRHSRSIRNEDECNQRDLHRQDLDARLNWPLPNVWLGTSVEDQATAEARIPHLLATPAAVRFVSAEPLLGPVDMDAILAPDMGIYALTGIRSDGSGPSGFSQGPRLDWVIVGGESGPGARPMHPGWARSLRDQCQAAGVAYFFKQWGEWAPALHDPEHDGYILRQTENVGQFDSWKATVFDPNRLEGVNWRRLGKSRAGRLLDGREWNQMPGVRA